MHPGADRTENVSTNPELLRRGLCLHIMRPSPVYVFRFDHRDSSRQWGLKTGLTLRRSVLARGSSRQRVTAACKQLESVRALMANLQTI